MWRSPAIDASTIYSPAGAAFCSARALRVFQGTDLTGFAGHNLVARPVQSGCLPCGSLLTTVRRQSAIRHRHVAARPSAGSAPWYRGKPQHMASRSHGQRPSLPGVFQSSVAASSHRGPLHGNKLASQWSQSIQGRLCVLQSNSRHGQAGSPPLPLRAPRLTGRSTGRLPAKLVDVLLTRALGHLTSGTEK
ncbi:hypothetical protein AQB9606_03963 [Aquabacterium sp. CECT 9606]|nr:hypothetical protein AQB9606_03963 [Aquabacterium sp. CECT 9606]